MLIKSPYLVTRGSMLFFCSKASIVTGNVAELDAVPNAVNKALPMLDIKRKGSRLVINPENIIFFNILSDILVSCFKIVHHKRAKLSSCHHSTSFQGEPF